MSDLDEFLRKMAEQSLRRAQKDDDDEIIDAIMVGDEPVAATIVERGADTPHSVPGETLRRDIDEADERMESHMQEVVEHKLGSLGASTSAPADSVFDHDDQLPAVATTHGIVALLRAPQSLRNLIVLSEILDRPEHRW